MPRSGRRRPADRRADTARADSMRATNPRRPVRPVAEVSTWGGVRVRLRDDWTWALAPGSRRPAGVVALILADLGAIGRVGEGVANLADTARAGAPVSFRAARSSGGGTDTRATGTGRCSGWSGAAAPFP